MLNSSNSITQSFTKSAYRNYHNLEAIRPSTASWDFRFNHQESTFLAMVEGRQNTTSTGYLVVFGQSRPHLSTQQLLVHSHSPCRKVELERSILTEPQIHTRSHHTRRSLDARSVFVKAMRTPQDSTVTRVAEHTCESNALSFTNINTQG